MGRVLGVDLGERRIGLALSDALGLTAGPLVTIERRGSAESDRAAIVAAARDHEAERIVVGMPTSMSGRPGPAARAAAAEIEAIRAIAGPDLPVDAHDERLTTVTAQRALAAARVKKGKRRALVDQVAAAVMLQSWLDSRPPSPPAGPETPSAPARPETPSAPASPETPSAPARPETPSAPARPETQP